MPAPPNQHRHRYPTGRFDSPTNLPRTSLITTAPPNETGCTTGKCNAWRDLAQYLYHDTDSPDASLTLTQLGATTLNRYPELLSILIVAGSGGSLRHEHMERVLDHGEVLRGPRHHLPVYVDG